MVMVLLAFIAGCQAPADEPINELVDIGSHQLYLTCMGSGRPVVVIEPGVGETYESWEPIMASVGQTTRVCAYERAGYGRSELGPMPRDSLRAAQELHRLLEEASVDGPYLLVGHSLGALNMQVFADKYADQVAGAILLDPTPAAWINGTGFPELRALFRQEAAGMLSAAEAAAASGKPDEETRASFLASVASELEQLLENTAEQVAAIDSFGDLSLIVIGATEADPNFGESAEAFRQFWNEESRRLAEKSERGQFILAEGSGHQIHLDKPELVAEQINRMVQGAGP